MQVSSSTLSTLPVPISRRDDIAERRQSARSQSDAAASEQSAQSTLDRGEVTRIRARVSAEAQRADIEASAFSDQLDGRSRAAVQAYRSNGPSIEERLGVELAGVDVYA